MDNMSILKNLLLLTLVLSEVTSRGRMLEPLEGDCTRFAYEYRILEQLILLEQENKDLKSRLDQLERGRQETAVAVKVGLSKNQDLGKHGRVMYDDVISNVGKAFDIEKGEFMAPVSGVYMVVVQACLVGTWIDLDIIKDGTKVGRVFSGDPTYHNCGSEAVSMRLEQGSKLWVVRVAGTTTVLNEDHGRNSFVAALIQQDA